MKFHLPAILSSLALGAGFSALQPGIFFIGWLLFSFLFLLSFYVLRFASQWATNLQPSTFNVQLAITLAFLLRLALGLTFYLVLPLQSNAGVDHQNGYIYFDAYRRDEQAWELAQSDQPVWESFNKTHYSDQYGGLLAILTVSYRYLSPDAHRPLLPILFAALFAALGIPFLWKSADKLWGEKIALFAVWVYALYPESILLGSSQMREPFLMTFMAMALWGFVARGAEWSRSTSEKGHSATKLKSNKADYQSAPQVQSAWLWLALGFLGMLLLSPAIALLTLVLFAGWTWVTREHGRISWAALLVTGLVFVAGLYLLAWGLEREQPFGASPFGIIMNWSRDAVKWDTYQLERGSGWIQKLFSEMPDGLHPLFVMVYGLTQPVLPAAFVEPTTLPLRLLGIFRAAGWYALVPLLFYAPFAAARAEAGAKRRLWYWLIALVWLWSIVAALRGGADQWDNPRYRAILIVVQAVVAAFAWGHRDRWLARWIAVEVVFLVFFTQWYASRYYHLGGQIPFGLMVALIFASAALIIGGGWWRDRRRKSLP
jgi:hypothetical protein